MLFDLNDPRPCQTEQKCPTSYQLGKECSTRLTRLGSEKGQSWNLPFR
jgi:hypothetical protein